MPKNIILESNFSKLPTNFSKLPTNFYWENLDHNYPVDKELKYCVFLNGCFCPPHKGHIQSIKNIIELLGPDTKIIINQIGSTSRHGVPSYFNKLMMELYILNVFPSNSNIKLLFRASNKEIFLDDFVLKSDILVILRGDEVNLQYKESDTDVSNINSRYEYKFRKIIKYLNKKNIRIDFIFQFRPVSKVSATNFVRLLNLYKEKRKKKEHTLNDIYEIYWMMPEELSIELKHRLLKELLNFNVYDKKIKKIDY